MRSPVGIDSRTVVDKYNSWKLGDRRYVDVNRQLELEDYKYTELDVVVDEV
jgi:hypothetical protein